MSAAIAPFKVITGKARRPKARRASRVEVAAQKAEEKARAYRAEVLVLKVRELAQERPGHLVFIESLVSNLLTRAYERND